jgi:hypothetical protein
MIEIDYNWWGAISFIIGSIIFTIGSTFFILV